MQASLLSLGNFSRPHHCSLGYSSFILSFPFSGGSDAKESACNAGDLGSIPGLGRSPREGNSYPLQYSCLENPKNRAAWQVHRLANSQTRLSDFHFPIKDLSLPTCFILLLSFHSAPQLLFFTLELIPQLQPRTEYWSFQMPVAVLKPLKLQAVKKIYKLSFTNYKPKKCLFYELRQIKC